MLKMRQSLGLLDVTTTVSFDVFYRDLGREAASSAVWATATVSEPALVPQYPPGEDVGSVLKDCCSEWLRWFESEIARRYDSTGGGLEIIADVLQSAFDDPSSFGPAVINLSTDDDLINREPFAEAQEQKEHLRQFLEVLASRMGLQHPAIAASASVRIIEQTIVWVQRSGSPREAHTARLLLECLRHA